MNLYTVKHKTVNKGPGGDVLILDYKCKSFYQLAMCKAIG